MSNKEKKNIAPAEENAEKIITKYDRKMQKRQEEKEREKREKNIWTAIGVVILIALAAYVISIPVRTYLSIHKTYIKIGDADVTKVEFDYVYGNVVNNFVNQNSQYLSWIGLDVSADFASQPYYGSSTRSWKDYFDEKTVDVLRANKSLKADAAAKGFTKDVTEDYDRLVESNRTAAKEAGISYGAFLKQNYGKYATESRLKPFLEENVFVNAYYKKLIEDMTPGEDEIKAKYNENPQDYDSVDYLIKQFDAELPTEPTELADPAVETETVDGEEESPYIPSDAEVAKAMADAKDLAEAAKSTIATDGEQVTGISYSSANNAIREWLFDNSRQSGDITVLEDTSADKVYCVQFQKRYLDETPTVDLRILVAESEEQANEIYNDWKAGGATEDYFIELCNGKYLTNSVNEDGLYEGVSKDEDLLETMQAWVFADGRAAGDCEVVNETNGTSFVIYYVGESNPKWYNTIKNDLRSVAVNDYVTNLKENCQVSDPYKNLHYLEVEAEEKAAAEALEAINEAESATVEESAAEESTTSESAAEESTASESAAEESTASERASEESTASESAAEESTASESAAEESAASESAAE